MFDFKKPSDLLGLRFKKKEFVGGTLGVRWHPKLFDAQPAWEFPGTILGMDHGGSAALAQVCGLPLCELFEGEKHGFRPYKKKWYPKVLRKTEGHIIAALGALSAEYNAVHVIPQLNVVEPIRLELDREQVCSPAVRYVSEWDRRYWFLLRQGEEPMSLVC